MDYLPVIPKRLFDRVHFSKQLQILRRCAPLDDNAKGL